MSSAARWAYTRTATHWPRTSFGDWSRVSSFGEPVRFACDYIADGRRGVAASGDEFVTRLRIFTERATVQPGDYVALGAHSVADPSTLNDAHEVRAVRRYSDTFSAQADDFEVQT